MLSVGVLKALASLPPAIENDLTARLDGQIRTRRLSFARPQFQTELNVSGHYRGTGTWPSEAHCSAILTASSIGVFQLLWMKIQTVPLAGGEL